MMDHWQCTDGPGVQTSKQYWQSAESARPKALRLTGLTAQSIMHAWHNDSLSSRAQDQLSAQPLTKSLLGLSVPLPL